MAHVIVGSARIDEHGQAHGGAAGDQTGKEVSTQNWYLHKQGSWRVFRPKDSRVAKRIAACMRAACDNPYIGYDQWQRDTLYNAARAYDFDCTKVRKNVECDCSSLVRVCMAYAGIHVDSFRTYEEGPVLLATGAFTEMKGKRYQQAEEYLKIGDILVTPAQGHTVVVLSNGEKAGQTPPAEETETEMDDDMDTIRRGSKGAQVRTLQRLLNAITSAGLEVDGDFGPATERALKAYQESRKLTVDGICGGGTWKMILKGE